MNDTRLESVLGRDYKIIKLFLIDHDREITLTEAVRELGISKMTLYRGLENLVKKGMLSSRTDNYRNFYKLRESHVNRALKVLANVESPVISNLLKGLHYKNPTILLYGSRANGSDKRDSDWDILIISDEMNPVELNKKTSEIERRFDCQLNANLLSKKEFNKIRKERTPFYLEVIMNKYVLRGDLDEA
jgi:predicted nucleotidyltransferase